MNTEVTKCCSLDRTAAELQSKIVAGCEQGLGISDILSTEDEHFLAALRDYAPDKANALIKHIAPARGVPNWRNLERWLFPAPGCRK